MSPQQKPFLCKPGPNKAIFLGVLWKGRLEFYKQQQQKAVERVEAFYSRVITTVLLLLAQAQKQDDIYKFWYPSCEGNEVTPPDNL